MSTNEEIKISKVEPINTWVQPERDASIIKKELERLQTDLESQRNKQMESNKVKSLIAIIVAALVQIANVLWNFDVPDIVVHGLTMVLTFVAGLFLPTPKQ